MKLKFGSKQLLADGFERKSMNPIYERTCIDAIT